MPSLTSITPTPLPQCRFASSGRVSYKLPERLQTCCTEIKDNLSDLKREGIYLYRLKPKHGEFEYLFTVNPKDRFSFQRRETGVTTDDIWKCQPENTYFYNPGNGTQKIETPDFQKIIDDIEERVTQQTETLMENTSGLPAATALIRSLYPTRP